MAAVYHSLISTKATYSPVHPFNGIAIVTAILTKECSMLPTFSITPRGLVPTVQKQSCLPCRRKKKRCDGSRPQCSLCQDSYGRDECTWPSARRTRKRQIGTPGSSSMECETPETSTLSNPKPLNAPISCNMSLPDKLLIALPHVDPTTIVEASHTFQRRVLCNHPAYRGSVMALSLPLAIKHEPLLHAWISSILLAMPDDVLQWRGESVVHYDHAVRGLKTSVLIGSPSEEWKRATAMLCHAIELLQPVPSSHLARSHLSAAHHMFRPAVDNCELPINQHDTLLFEAYIIRTATNCLFQQDIHKQLPFDYVERLSAMHIGALEREALTMSPENCPWLSAYGPRMMDLVYKTSWIYAQDSLATSGGREAVEVWQSLDGIEETQDHHYNAAQDYDYTAVRRVYMNACRALLRPLVPGDDLERATLDGEALVSIGLHNLGALTQGSSDDITMLWPLIVLGALSTSKRTLCSEITTLFRASVSTHTVDSIMLFFAEAWEIQSVKLRFRDSETLRSILL